jgi:2,4-dienoyl-CoA reductase-like NADH-dependent reductase (Old Yellow Enzyme family)
MMPHHSKSGPKADSRVYLQPGRIGSLVVANRLIRTATSETMATERGEVTDELIDFYSTLARGGAGLLITGHAYVEEIGQCSARQIGIYADTLVPGLARLAAAVRQNGGRIFCELSHAGSQSVMPHIDPIAPSIIENAIFERQPRAMSEGDIQRIIAAFGQAARRAATAGFDGIHIHGGNGYLISQFNSPFSNRRSDQWGGDAVRRSRFFLAVYDAIRAAVGAEMPIAARYGLADSAPGQLQLDEGLTRLGIVAARGLNAVEPTYGLMTTYHENIRPYVAVTAARALQDWVFPRLWQPAQPEAYSMNPGFAYVAVAWQFAAEVIVPLNRDAGSATGFRAQLPFFLDDLIPKLFDKPLLSDKPDRSLIAWH